MFGLHIASSSIINAADAVKYGFIAWGLLALSMGVIFAVVMVLNRWKNRKDR